MSDTKKCSLCKATKPLTEFYLKPDGKPRARCKDCLRADSRRRDPIWAKANPEKCRAKVRRWQKRHPDAVRKYGRDGMRRLRRKKRDRGQTFLPLDAAPTSRSFFNRTSPTP
jgi:hypothetical protein